jgi:hypothetical protein
MPMLFAAVHESVVGIAGESQRTHKSQPGSRAAGIDMYKSSLKKTWARLSGLNIGACLLLD